jgi:hypothetical protein
MKTFAGVAVIKDMCMKFTGLEVPMRKFIFLFFLLTFGISPIALAALVDNGNGTVSDTNTGLMWKKASEPGTYTWADALSHCENLVYPEAGGYSDWRLPNRNELQTLVDYDRFNPAIDPLLRSTTIYCWGCPVYWSSTTKASNPISAWQVEFSMGGCGWYTNKSILNAVRSVRGGQGGSLGDSAISSLSPDPNPQISEVMAGGTAYRYYRTLGADGTPAPNVALVMDCRNDTTSSTSRYELGSDGSGNVRVELQADQLGNSDNTITCTVQRYDNPEEYEPVVFQVKLNEREIDMNYKLGLGINVKGGYFIGIKGGAKRGFVYTVKGKMSPETSREEVLVEWGSEYGLGAIGQVGVKIKPPVGYYGGISAELSLQGIFAGYNSYLFYDPFSPEQKKLKEALVYDSLFGLPNFLSPLIYSA